MRLINVHTHSTYCGHAKDSLADMVEAAHRAGISVLAATEHYPLTPRFDPERIVGMPRERLAEYQAEVRALQGRYEDMELLLGIELDWLGKGEDRTFEPGEFDVYDLVIGSVHSLDGWAFDDPAQRGHWDEVGPDEIWRQYFREWCAAVSSDAPFRLMAHPDLVKKFGIRPSFDPAGLYREAAEAAAASGRFVEVNTSGARYACQEFYPAPDLLREFARAGVPCTVSSDAHAIGHLTQGLDQAYAYLAAAGYRQVAIPHRGGEWELADLEEMAR